MKEEDFDLLVSTLINDLTLSFPPDQFPSVAASVTAMRIAYQRELTKKKLCESLGQQVPCRFFNIADMFTETTGAAFHALQPSA